MVDVFAEKTVIEKKPIIVLRKLGRGLLYTIGVAAVSFVLDAFTSGNVPNEWMVYGSIVIALLQTVKKSLETYDKRKDR